MSCQTSFLAAGNAREELQANDFDFEFLFDGMFAAKFGVDGIQRLGVKVTFAALGADFRIHVLNNVEAAIKPMVLGDLLCLRLPVTEFAFHRARSFAYALALR